MERSEHAKELFLSGYNCAQSVVLTFAEDLNTSEGSAKFKEEKIMENICAGCVKKAVEIVESITA